MSYFYMAALLLSFNLSSLQLSETTFFKALYSTSLEKIEAALTTLTQENKSDLKTKAFHGTLLMKKSGFMKTPAQKIKIFKEGNKLLENAIQKAPDNILFRFLRITIQENAPKILKYNAQIKEDADIVIKGYQKLSSTQQRYVLDYAKQSSSLKTIVP